ncbi:set5 [Symbiodinium natans]|uniref:Set5 protein n=1 Tax=Symbiodinium natans TaxID=878477 RepID=A0A812QCU0_9DINO|nr:set5 [Symbiodinium natans]
MACPTEWRGQGLEAAAASRLETRALRWATWKRPEVYPGRRTPGTCSSHRKVALCLFATISAARRPRAAPRHFAARAALGGSFDFRAIDGKGLGALATAPLRRGDCLLREVPLLRVDTGRTSALDDEVAWQALDSHLREELAALPRQEEAKFWALEDAFTDGEKMAAGILYTNAVDCNGQAMLFPDMSRLNHSCRPNVVHSWQDGEVVLHATRSIQPGEELCLCYVPAFLSQEQRQVQLTRRWRFSCCCPVCSSENLLRSDELRLRLAALDAQLSAKMRRWQSRDFNAQEAESAESELLSQVSEMTELICEEFGPHPALLCQLFYDAFVLLLLLGRARNSGRMIRLALEESQAREAVEVASAAALSASQRLLQSRLQDVRRHRHCDATQTAAPAAQWESNSPAEGPLPGDTVYRSSVPEVLENASAHHQHGRLGLLPDGRCCRFKPKPLPRRQLTREEMVESHRGFCFSSWWLDAEIRV